MENGRNKMENGRNKMENGRNKMENGRNKMENGRTKTKPLATERKPHTKNKNRPHTRFYSGEKVGRSTGSISFGNVTVIDNVSVGDGSLNNPIIHPYILPWRLEMNVSASQNFSITQGRFDMTLQRNSNFTVY